MLDIIFVKEVFDSLLIASIFIIIYLIIKRILKKITKVRFYHVKDSKRKTLMVLITNIIKYFLMAMAFIMILSIFGVDTKTFVASLGVLSVVVGLALQDILKDILAGFFIIFEGQYGIGDTIKIGDFKGEVTYIGLKTTKVKSGLGEIKFFSNRNIQEVINYSLSKSIAIVNVLVSSDEDVQKVEKVLEESCINMTNKIPYLSGEVKLLGITNINAAGTEFRITAETKTLKNYDVERLILKEIKLEFEKNKISVPSNQPVILNG